MRVLYHHRTRCSGADGTHIKGVVQGFEKLGYQVDIISLGNYGGGCSQKADPEKAQQKKKKSIFIRMPRFLFEFLELAYNLPACIHLLYYACIHRFDIVYERYAFLNLGGFCMSLLGKKPLFLEVNFTTQTTVYPKRTGIFSWLETAIERLVFRHAVIIIVISDKLKNDIAAMGVAFEKIIVLPNAVDIEKFKLECDPQEIRLRHGIQKGDKVIGFVGSFYPWHGVDFLLDAYKEVLAFRRDVRLLLIGDGQMSAKLKEQVAREGLNDYVIFTGPVSHDNLPGYLAAFDIGVMPDSNNYGSPMKIFEYMAMAKPIVAPRLSPIESVIVHGRQGLLFPQRDKQGLVDALMQLLSDDGLCARMGSLGREKVIAEHTWVENVRKMTRFYESNVKSKKRG
ncbi:MAG: glycosyltransferase family 4 protein [Candidatus Omnitrophota bacterium]